MASEESRQFTVTEHPDAPFEHDRSGRLLTSTVIKVNPAPEVGDEAFAAAGLQQRPPVVTIPGPRQEDGSMTFELTTRGHGEEARQRLSRAVGGIVALGDQWQNPRAYFHARYGDGGGERPEPTPAASSAEDEARDGKTYIAYEEFSADPDDYFRRLGRGERIEVVMRLEEDWTDEDRENLGQPPADSEE